VLFNMTRIWERYAKSWLATRHRAGEAILPQHRIPLTDSDPTWEGRADFVVEAGGRPAAVYDAKYRQRHARPATSELYQLLAYTRRLGVRYAARRLRGVSEAAQVKQESAKRERRHGGSSRIKA
jgi:5-methylcytosine-specific restriction endonuclease McrBC regulatory subunit McrC